MKINLYIFGIFLVFVFIPTSFLFSQNAKVIYPHSVFWSKFEINEIFQNNWGVGIDYVYRRKNSFGSGSMFEQPLRESVRPWIHYQFNPYARASISPIGYMNTNEYLGKSGDEDRFSYYEIRTTLQFFHHTKQLSGRIIHTWRYRYELRWQEQENTSAYRFLTRFRFRYRIRYLFNTNDFYKNKVFYTAISNEIGLNLGKNVLYNTFNQNRLYVGLGYRFFNAMRVEARYVNRFRTRGSTGYEFDNGQGFMLGVYVDQVSALFSRDIKPVKFYD